MLYEMLSLLTKPVCYIPTLYFGFSSPNYPEVRIGIETLNIHLHHSKNYDLLAYHQIAFIYAPASGYSLFFPRILENFLILISRKVKTYKLLSTFFSEDFPKPADYIHQVMVFFCYVHLFLQYNKEETAAVSSSYTSLFFHTYVYILI